MGRNIRRFIPTRNTTMTTSRSLWLKSASSDGKLFVPGLRFFGGKLRFVHCLRQVPPGADLLALRHQPGERLPILQQHKGGVLIRHPVYAVGKTPAFFRNRNRRFLHTIRLLEFMVISIRAANKRSCCFGLGLCQSRADEP